MLGNLPYMELDVKNRRTLWRHVPVCVLDIRISDFEFVSDFDFRILRCIWMTADFVEAAFGYAIIWPKGDPLDCVR
jgi:hypothetical protein